VWISSERTFAGLLGTAPAGSGTRNRGREPHVHPDQIKRLPTGVAAVVVPAGADQPRVVQILRVQVAGGVTTGPGAGGADSVPSGDAPGMEPAEGGRDDERR
jgi:hypothetical protein